MSNKPKVDVLVVVTGPTGSGKSIVMMEIERALKAAGFELSDHYEGMNGESFKVKRGVSKT